MIYLVIYKFNHHYSASGYNRLAEFLPCRKITIPGLIEKLLQRSTTQQRRNNLKETTGLLGYFPECVWLEWWTGALAKLPMASVFHFIYPENSYFFTASYKRYKKAKIVATYHQPLLESKQFILKTEAISKLDALILLSESQREFFEPLIGNERIFVVPHGIDLDFFSPPVHREPKRRIIAVGNWLRDFQTLVEALKLLQRQASDIVCDVVTLEQNRGLFAGLQNVSFHSGISDPAILKLYHQTSISVLALTGAGANNALLESMACGLPIVATDLPSVREYTTPQGTRYVPARNGAILAETILSTFAEGDKRLAEMGATNRKHAGCFAWENIAKQTMEVYARIS